MISKRLGLFVLALVSTGLQAKKANHNLEELQFELRQTKRALQQAQQQIVQLQNELNSAQAYPLIDSLYVGANGFLISAEEKNAITERGGAPTYGEIKYASIQAVLNDLDIKEGDVFVDLGSGVGKTAVLAHLNFPFKKSVGVELAPSRHRQANDAAKKLRDRTLEFKQEDIVTTDLSDATVVYMCSTCFSDALMNKLLDKFATLKPGLTVITLKELPARYPELGFELVKKYNLPMSWSTGNTVHVYKLKGAPLTR